jgi:DNA-binding response OmpR family regulator
MQFRGYDVLAAANGQEGLSIAFEERPDLVILDLMMPKMDGWSVCQRLREIGDMPILVLTALSSEAALVRSFELGADDFLTKPINLRELELRVLGLLRRVDAPDLPEWPVYDDGTLEVDLVERRVTKNGHQIHLTATEYRLLCYLVRHAGQTVSHEHLIQTVWGSGQVGKMSSLGFYINVLRKKLEDDPSHPQYILSERGVGYRFAAAGAQVDGQEPL